MQDKLAARKMSGSGIDMVALAETFKREVERIEKDFDLAKHDIERLKNENKSLKDERDHAKEEVDQLKLNYGIAFVERPIKARHDWGVVLSLKQEYFAFRTSESIASPSLSNEQDGLLLFLSMASRVQFTFETHLTMEGFSASESDSLARDVMGSVVCRLLLQWDAHQLSLMLVHMDSGGSRVDCSEVRKMVGEICRSVYESVKASTTVKDFECVKLMKFALDVKITVQARASTLLAGSNADIAETMDVESGVEIKSAAFMQAVRTSMLLAVGEAVAVGKVQVILDVKDSERKLEISIHKMADGDATEEALARDWFVHVARDVLSSIHVASVTASAMGSMDMIMLSAGSDAHYGDIGDSASAVGGGDGASSVHAGDGGSSVPGSGVSAMSMASLKTNLRTFRNAYEELFTEYRKLEDRYISINTIRQDVTEILLGVQKENAALKGKLYGEGASSKPKYTTPAWVVRPEPPTDPLARLDGHCHDIEEMTKTFELMGIEDAKLFGPMQLTNIHVEFVRVLDTIKKINLDDEFIQRIRGEVIHLLEDNWKKVFQISRALKNGADRDFQRLIEKFEIVLDGVSNIRSITETDPVKEVERDMITLREVAGYFETADANTYFMGYASILKRLTEKLAGFLSEPAYTSEKDSMIAECNDIRDIWNKVRLLWHTRIPHSDYNFFSAPYLKDIGRSMEKIASICGFLYEGPPAPPPPPITPAPSAPPASVFSLPGGSTMNTITARLQTKWPELALSLK